MLSRLKEAWQVLTGKRRGYPLPSYHYITVSEPENKLIQLMPWQDKIAALDAQGKIWAIDFNSRNPLESSIQLIMDGPTRRY